MILKVSPGLPGKIRVVADDVSAVELDAGMGLLDALHALSAGLVDHAAPVPAPVPAAPVLDSPHSSLAGLVDVAPITTPSPASSEDAPEGSK